MDIFERFCPVCKNKNDREAIICVHCGASLETYLPDSLRTRTTEMQANGTEKSGELLFNEALVPDGGIALYIAGARDPIFSWSDQEFIIGRQVGETSEAFLDLSAMGGYHMGLSRRHAAIRRAERGYEVIDLASSNGTWLNDERLIPNKPYPLVSGSELRLARMRLFVRYRPVLANKQRT